tara:strand:- start:4072 stop:5580 length:1509 start_codon:yes stop_codon:yes gene_type:complete
MKIILSILACFILLIVNSCQKFKEKEELRKNDQTQTDLGKNISISLEKYLGHDTILYEGGSFSKTIVPKLLYTNPVSVQTNLLSINTTDTLQTSLVITESPFIILQHKYDYDDFEFFIFQPGDSVRISYQLNGRPIAKILNRGTLKYDLGLKDLAVGQPMSQQEAYLRNYGIVGVNNLPIERQISIKSKYDKFVSGLKDYYHGLIQKIDSVYVLGQMSKEVYNTQKTYYTFKAMSGDQVLEKMNNLTFKQQDSLFRYDFTRSAITFSFMKLGYKQVQTTNSVGKIDYRVIMDSIINDTNLSPYTKDYLLYSSMSELGKANSFIDTKIYFTKFKQAVSDKSLVTELENSLLIDSEKLLSSKDTLHLVYNDKSLKTFENFLSENKGKVIYIDFWASWCAPCIEEMPASARLRDIYKNQPISFLYLSIDKDFEGWNRANTEQKLRRYENSYMIINKLESNLLNQLGLSSIPRYLIFDKQGRLVDENAPRPSHASLRVIIDSLITH